MNDSTFEIDNYRGLLFQDYITDYFLDNFGYKIQTYSSELWQRTVGENVQGIEIKLDVNCFRTGRFSIEIEARGSTESKWTPSGIYHATNPKYYIHGNYLRACLIKTEVLRNLHKEGRFEEHEEYGTIRGFYLPIEEALKHDLTKGKMF